MIMKGTVAWDVTPWSLVGIYHFKERAASSFYPEGGGNRFLKNVGKDLPNYMTSYPRRGSHSCRGLEISQVWIINFLVYKKIVLFIFSQLMI
jgi:hypothetical protein